MCVCTASTKIKSSFWEIFHLHNQGYFIQESWKNHWGSPKLHFLKKILYSLHTVKIGRPFFKKIISLCLPVCFGYEIILSDFLFLKKHKIPIIHMVDLTHILVSERVWVCNWYILYSSLIVVVVKNFSVAAVIGPALHKRLVF